MIEFYSTSDFDQSLELLTKKTKDGFAGVVNEICRAFIEMDIKTIRENRELIEMCNEFNIIKLRLPDKARNLSKSNGYRLYYLADKRKKEVTLLYVHPKKGAKGLDNISINTLKQLYSMYDKELVDGVRTKRDITNGLQIIQNEKP